MNLAGRCAANFMTPFCQNSPDSATKKNALNPFFYPQSSPQGRALENAGDAHRGRKLRVILRDDAPLWRACGYLLLGLIARLKAKNIV
jgi:hypothetical protein